MLNITYYQLEIHLYMFRALPTKFLVDSEKNTLLDNFDMYSIMFVRFGHMLSVSLNSVLPNSSPTDGFGSSANMLIWCDICFDICVLCGTHIVFARSYAVRCCICIRTQTYSSACASKPPWVQMESWLSSFPWCLSASGAQICFCSCCSDYATSVDSFCRSHWYTSSTWKGTAQIAGSHPEV
jgi:hypothetical protein